MDFLTDPFNAHALEWTTLPLRIVLGVIYIHSGYGKFHRGMSGFGGWLEELGYPFPQPTARLVTALEFFGGIAILSGFMVHWIAIPLAFNMLVAAYTNAVKLHLPFSGNENAQGYELDFALMAGLLALVIGGAGPLSIDQLLENAFVD